MCSWCWGFRATWQDIQERLPSEVKTKYLLGGLAPDSDAPMPLGMQQQIAAYWKKIQAHIPGTEFNYDFWEECEPRRSTYPACRAVIAARNQNPQVEKKMIEAIQKAYYLKAQNPSDDSTLIGLAGGLNLDTEVFRQDLRSKETQLQLEKEIQMGQRIGAQGFPSLILEKEGNYLNVPLDYNRSEGTLDFILENS